MSTANEPNPEDPKSQETAIHEYGLPEQQPLTPELVEEEAIRGDFVLRWAVVLLAFLLGCTAIYESQTLVHIRSGEVIASNFGVAPSADPFAYTTADRTWINLSWLFDLLIATDFLLVGFTGLSLSKALLAGVIFYLLVRTSKEDVPTWWGSVTAGLTLLVCYQQFTATPEIITLLGLALLGYLLFRWQETRQAKLLWMVPLLILLWGNMDARMFLGLAFLILYGAGDLIGELFGHPTFTEPHQRKFYWKITGVSLAAACLNRFGWHALLSPVDLYMNEYPAILEYIASRSPQEAYQYFPMMDVRYWEMISHQGIAGLIVVGLGLLTCLLNFREGGLGACFTILGLSGFAVLSGNELAPVALVACSLGTVNAQCWYQSNFRQTYSLDRKELIFSRGGRAITVLALFFLAFLSTSGRLNGPNGRRTSLGLSEELEVATTAYREELAESYDNRPFNFTPDQGDQLIWVGKQVFIDSRLGLFTGEQEDNLIAKHKRARQAVRLPQKDAPGTGLPTVWKTVLDEYEVTHVIPRLIGTSQDYITTRDLLLSINSWQMTGFGTVIPFYRRDLIEPKLTEYLRNRGPDLHELAFRTQAKEVLTVRPGWAEPPTFYENFLNQRPTHMPREAISARHPHELIQHLNALRIQVPPQNVISLYYLTIRRANETLAKEPNCAMAYRLLGHAYLGLEGLEGYLTAAAREDRRPLPTETRYLQAVMALNQAILLEPNSPGTHQVLAQIYSNKKKYDFELREWKAFLETLDPNTPHSESFRKSVEERVDLLEAEMEKAEKFMTEELNKGTGAVSLAMKLHQQGFSGKTLLMLNGNPEKVAESLQTQILHANLLMESGEVEEAYSILQQMEGFGEQNPMALQWQNPAARANLGSGNFERTTAIWTKEIKAFRGQLLMLLNSVPIMGTLPSENWFQFRGNLSQSFVIPAFVSERQFYTGTTYLEAGDVENARITFQKALEEFPQTPYRPLLKFYLELVTGEPVPLLPKETHIPMDPKDMFTPPEKTTEKRKPVIAPRPKT